MQHTKQLNIARPFALLLTAVMLLGVLAFAVPSVSAAESGSCGSGLNWTFNAGTLTISGSGDMTNYHDMKISPWNHLKEAITRIVLSSGITSIGSNAFSGCKNVTSVVFPDTLKTVGAFSFAECSNLQLVRFGSRVETIGNGAFHSCFKLDGVRLPYSLSRIGYQAFYRCESLSSISIPQNVSALESAAFAFCTNLVTAEISATLSSIAEWMFYGCDNLNIVVLPATVKAVDTYAFKNCEQLETVYFDGSIDKKLAIENDIVQDVPSLESEKFMTTGAPSGTASASKTTSNGDGTKTQQSTSVRQDENMTVSAKVEHTLPEKQQTGGTYVADVKVTVENSDGWQSATTAVKSTLKEINKQYSVTNATPTKIDVTVYVKEDTSVDSNFVKEMVGRDVEMTVVTQNGSQYRVECSEVEKETLTGEYNYSYNLVESTADVNTKLGTTNCYMLNFHQSAKINAEILIKLPKDYKGANSFLYQIEGNGEYTRLQAVAIDNDNYAHFYLGAVDKDTQYIIGINVPGEKTDDLIIPDELLPQYGGAVERLQKIDYVITGRKSSWGLTAKQVTIILIASLVLCIVIVGVIMALVHKHRLKTGYYERKMLLYAEGEDFDDDDDEDSDEDDEE